MQIYQHLSRDDTASATVRLNRTEMAELRKFMHTPEFHQFVGFPNGVRLYYRSKGWYRLEATRDYRACDKIRAALAILRKFKREFQALLVTDIRRLILAKHPELQTVAYVDESDNALIGTFHVRNTKEPLSTVAPMESRLPVDSSKLEELAATFAKSNRTRHHA
jgi:hypothetical protein